jgi:hydrogenase maturation protease
MGDQLNLIILGLGNPVLSDDAVGLHVVAELEELFSADPVPGVTLQSGTRAGFELLDFLAGFDHAIIIDAFQATEPEPGRVRHINPDDIRGSTRLMAVHEINLGTVFDLALKLKIAMPEKVEIFGIEVEEVYTFSESLSPKVAAAVAPLSREIFGKVKELAAVSSPA